MGKLMRLSNEIQHPLTVKTRLEWDADEEGGRVKIDVTRPTEDEAIRRCGETPVPKLWEKIEEVGRLIEQK